MLCTNLSCSKHFLSNPPLEPITLEWLVKFHKMTTQIKEKYLIFLKMCNLLMNLGRFLRYRLKFSSAKNYKNISKYQSMYSGGYNFNNYYRIKIK